jgi:allantoin racemase
MSDILYLMPGKGAAKEEKLRREKIANTFLTSEKNRVFVDDVDEGPLSIESSIEGDLSVHGMLKKAILTKGKYDALIIGCADDPGLFSMRELLDIPVIGPFESSIAMASMIGEKFSVITILESGFPETRMILRKYGAEQKCASIRAINCCVEDMIQQKVSRDEVIDIFIRQAKLAESDGASSLILGCMTMAFLLLEEAVQEKISSIVINPAKVSVKMAEMMASMGLKHSVLSYPKPDFEKLKNSVLPELKNLERGK